MEVSSHLSTRTKRAKPAGKKAAPKETPKAEKPKVFKPTGRIPAAVVSARHGFSMVERRGKGFSRKELSEVGLPQHLALEWHVPVDLRRKSIIEANVSAIRKWYAQPKKAEEAASPRQPQAGPRKRTTKKKET